MKRTLVSIALSALALGGLAGVTPALAAGPGPAYLNVGSFSAEAENSNIAELSVATRGDIPGRADAFIRSKLGVGFAWVNPNSNTVFAMTIHPTLGVDSTQNPTGWHAHVVTLQGGATSPNDLCIKSVDLAPHVGISLDDNKLEVVVHRSDLPWAPASVKAAAGFIIAADSGCGSRLAVELVTSSSSSGGSEDKSGRESDVDR
jgi:hypothetical protein